MSVADYNILKARPEQARQLSDIAFRSKAYWGYSKEFMEACREELTFSEDEIRSLTCYVLQTKPLIKGFYILEPINKHECELGAVFVEADAMGKGYGKALMNHAKKIAEELSFSKITIQSDPNAVGFYQSVGARVTGEKPSLSIPGRFLPSMEINL